jgi:ABC-type antimicrobial peptide transport system permease subunit
MDILERRFELSTLRAIGTRPHQVLLLLLTPLALVVLSGLLAGSLVVLAAISVMGGQPRLPLGPDLGVPLSIDAMTFLMVLGIGAAAALIGTVPSLASVLGRSPMEVLRDAP